MYYFKKHYVHPGLTPSVECTLISYVHRGLTPRVKH